jgi:uncharacterized NAD-dependent epimerase/dehydratase family protein
VGITQEIMAIESVEPTKVVGISLNLRNVNDDEMLVQCEEKFGLPTADVYHEGASKLMDAILKHTGKGEI